MGGLAKTHHNAQKAVNEICKNLDLVDAWRVLNPGARRYTWCQPQPAIHCRLDFFLTSQSFLGNVTLTDILPGFKTDHPMIIFQIFLH